MKKQSVCLLLVLSCLAIMAAGNPWGTLKPNLYFAIKERAKEESVLGLAWMVKDWRTDALIVRHDLKYGDPVENIKTVYTMHDGQNFARQTITDEEYNCRFQIDFLQDQGDQSLDWDVRVRIEAVDPSRSIKVVPFLYLRKDKALDAVPFGITLEKTEADDSVIVKAVKIVQKTLHTADSYQVFQLQKQGQDQDLGVFSLNTADMKNIEQWQPDLVIANYAQQMLGETVANEMDPDLIVMRLGQPNYSSSAEKKSEAISSVQDGDTYQLSFHRADFSKKREAQSYSRTSHDFDDAIKQAEQKFNERFHNVFLKAQFGESDPEFIRFQKEALSNLLGNVGHQYGTLMHLVPLARRQTTIKEGSHALELLASYPARSRFPHGFLFDEGFHLLLICQWSDTLCVDIFRSWFQTQGEKAFGEILKEQARGPEARHKIPEDDQAIKNGALSVPTLHLPLNLLLDLAAESEAIRKLLKELYPKVIEWFHLFEIKLANSAIPCTFSFRGRTAHLNEQSGLDDYPRGIMVHDKGEVHLDLQSTMVEFALTLQEISLMLQGENSVDAAAYGNKAECYAKSMKDYLLNEQYGYFADYMSLQVAPISSAHQHALGEMSELVEWREDMGCGQARLNSVGTPAKCNQPYMGDPIKDMARCCRTNRCDLDIDCTCPLCTEFTSLDDDHMNNEQLNQHSVHLGIVNFFPLFYGLVDDEKVLMTMLDLLKDENRMMAAHGVRSLSARDQFYQLDSKTYRGNLFVHLHYLLLRGLKTYYMPESISMKDKPELAAIAKTLYDSIRAKILQTVYTQWKEDGQLYEMYEPETGKGLGTAPFNGWTSLIVLIASEKYH